MIDYAIIHVIVLIVGVGLTVIAFTRLFIPAKKNDEKWREWQYRKWSFFYLAVVALIITIDSIVMKFVKDYSVLASFGWGVFWLAIVYTLGLTIAGIFDEIPTKEERAENKRSKLELSKWKLEVGFFKINIKRYIYLEIEKIKKTLKNRNSQHETREQFINALFKFESTLTQKSWYREKRIFNGKPRLTILEKNYTDAVISNIIYGYINQIWNEDNFIPQEKTKQSLKHVVENKIKEENQENLLFIDVETTGIPNDFNAPVSNTSNWPRIVQIAWLIFSTNGDCLTEKNRVIIPGGFLIPNDSVKIHGIKHEEALEKGADLKIVLEELREDLINVDTIIAHNINFDMKVIGAEYYRVYNRDALPRKKQICTMEQSTNYCAIPNPTYSGYKWPTLDELHRKLFNKGFKGEHNALNDVKATARCFFRLKELGVISESSVDNGISDDDDDLPF